MPVGHVDMIGLIRRHIRRNQEIIQNAKTENRKQKYFLYLALPHKSQVIKACAHGLRKQKHGKEILFQEQIEIRMGVHAEPDRALRAVYQQGILFVITLWRHNH